MIKNMENKGTTHREKTLIWKQTKSKMTIKQLSFQGGGLSNLYSPRNCNTQLKELHFNPPQPQNTKSEYKIDPSNFFKEELNLSIAQGLFASEELRKKVFSCQNRKDYIDLANWLRNCLAGLQNITDQNEVTQQAMFEYLQKVYNSCMSEIITKTRAESTEKAALLEIVWQNILRLLIWLDKYYRKRLTNEVHRLTLKSDQVSRGYLFTIDNLQSKITEITNTQARQDNFFYQVVKDNRLLRQRNHKMIQRLKYEMQGNRALKEENLKFYKENEKMKLVITQEDQSKQLQVLARKLREVEIQLLDKNKITKNSVLREIRKTEIGGRMQEQINMIIKRINEQDLLDLDYCEPCNTLNLESCYVNNSAQTTPCIQSRGTNTYTFLELKRDQVVQTQRCLNIESNVYSWNIIESLPKPKITNPSMARRGSRLSRESILVRIAERIQVPENNTTQQKIHQLPKINDGPTQKITFLYDTLSKTADSLRMELVALPLHERSRIKRETNGYAVKAIAEIKKLFGNVSITNNNTDKTIPERMLRMRTSISDSESIHRKYRNSISVNNGEELRRILQDEDRAENDYVKMPTGMNIIKKGHGAVSARLNPGSKNSIGSHRVSIASRPLLQTSKIDTNLSSDTCRPIQSNHFFASTLSVPRKSCSKPMTKKQVDALNDFDTIIEYTHNPPEYTQQCTDNLRKNSAASIPETKSSNKKMAEQSLQKISLKPLQSKSHKRSDRMSQALREYSIPQICSEGVQSAAKIRTSIQPYVITSNFQNRQELIRFFENAIRQPSLLLKQTKKEKEEPIAKIASIDLGQKCGYVHQGIHLESSNQVSLSEGDQKKPALANFLGRIQQALNSREKELKGQLKDINVKKTYSRNMLKKLFNFFVRQIYKQKENVFKKDNDFQTFFQQWMLFRYGLQEIYFEVMTKIKASINKYHLQCLEFRCLYFLMGFGGSQKKFFNRGLFKIFALFVQFGVQKAQLLKGQNYSADAELSDTIAFIKELLKVFLGPGDISQFISLLTPKQKTFRAGTSTKVQINIFEVFIDLGETLQFKSKNTQISSLMRCLSQVLNSNSNEQITLESLLTIWSVIEPNEPRLLKNIIRLVKFCSIDVESENQKLVIPIYKLTLLAKRFDWTALICPVKVINDRYVKEFGEPNSSDIANNWESERQQISIHIRQHPQILQLLDNKMIRFKVNNVLKDNIEPFPLLLYQVTKLALANDIFNKHSHELIEDRFQSLSGILAQLERKIQFAALSI